MKLRVRTTDGGTLKVEADKTSSVRSFIAQLELPPALVAARGDFGLSLNKKDILNPDSTLEANGIRGGDLVHLVSRGSVGGSPSRPLSAAAPPPAAAASYGGPEAAGDGPAAPPRSNLFGLPTAAPTSDARGGSAALVGSNLVRDSSGRVWQESVAPTSRPAAAGGGGGVVAGRQREDTAEESRRQRLLAIERRLGLATQKRDRPETDSPSTARQDSGPQVQTHALHAGASSPKPGQTPAGAPLVLECPRSANVAPCCAGVSPCGCWDVFTACAAGSCAFRCVTRFPFVLFSSQGDAGGLEVGDMLTALLRQHGHSCTSMSRADACALGVHCCMAKAVRAHFAVCRLLSLYVVSLSLSLSISLSLSLSQSAHARTHARIRARTHPPHHHRAIKAAKTAMLR